MPKPYVPLVAALLLAISFACKPKPSEALLDQVKTKLQLEEKPGFDISMGLPAEVTYAKATEVRTEAEILANKLGFRIEVSQGKKGFVPMTTYTLQDFKAPSLPGLSFQKAGSTVKIQADFQMDVVVESALPPKEGFETTQGKEKSAAEREKEIAEATAMGFKDAAKATDADIAASQEKRKELANAYAKAVDLVCKDNGYKRAWFITYRRKGRSTLPENSPFWEFADAWLATGGKEGFTVIPNAALLVLDQTSGWVKNHGQLKVKDSLTEYCIVAFEGTDGKLAKTDNWQAFL
jgi:hypothetical protein